AEDGIRARNVTGVQTCALPIWAYLMVAPTIIGLLVLNIYPFLDTIKLSFSKTMPFGLYELQGLDNYIEMFTSAEFWRANLNTLRSEERRVGKEERPER